MSTKPIMDIKKSVRRKAWPAALKREIVAATTVPGASVSAVARQYGVNTNLVFTWRRQLSHAAAESASALLPVVVHPDAPGSAAPSPPTETIEIELPRGYKLRIGGTTKAAALRLILDVLERR